MSAEDSREAKSLTRNPPSCARCRNHDVITPLKGHKRFCKFADCVCPKCVFTKERQKVMAMHTALYRAEEEDRRRAHLGLPTAEDGTVKDHPRPTNRGHRLIKSKSMKIEEELWDSILLLLNWCSLPESVSPLLLIILSKVSNDVEQVFTEIRKSADALSTTQEYLLNICSTKEESRE